jgi:copper chaperone
MSIQIKVPSIACEGCAETIVHEIKAHEPEAIVKVDLSSKTVTIDTHIPAESVKQMIIAAGHTPE